jgi:hypothetical protein
MFKGKVLLFSLLLVYATSLYAGEVHECKTSIGQSCSPMFFAACPQGDFDPISEACGGSNDYLWIIVMDSDSLPIEGIPSTDFYLNGCTGPPMYLCGGPFLADSATGSNGRTTISGPIEAGGCVMSGGIYLAVQSKVILQQPACVLPVCLNVTIISPDLVPDGEVKIGDLGEFSDSYHKAVPDTAYNPCCDYNANDTVSLSDFANFGEHLHHYCI